MVILHYSLGFPPYRSGGLTKFCMDLMGQQRQEGHEVSMLWPGSMGLLSKKTGIRKHAPVNGIGSYEVINPLPVSLDEGIRRFSAFTQPGDIGPYEALLSELRPDVIHVHTLMGLHESFLSAARKQKIRMVFTAHDYFPICPKVTLFRNGQICTCAESCAECYECNGTAISERKIILLQSGAYRRLKDTPLVKKLRKHHRDRFLGGNAAPTRQLHENDAKASADYLALRGYYGSILHRMDMIHFNSSVTRRVYHCFFEIGNECLIPITHADVSDQRESKVFSPSCLRIRYLGPQGGAKGFPILKDALDGLWEERTDFRLDVHFTMENPPAYMHCHAPYSYGELKTIFAGTDVLVCPSIWYETFGYTVLEALSFGVPVVISGTVGARDILADGAGIVLEDIDSRKLREALNGLTAERLSEMNRRIVAFQQIQTVESMSREIKEKLYRM